MTPILILTGALYVWLWCRWDASERAAERQRQAAFERAWSEARAAMAERERES